MRILVSLALCVLSVGSSFARVDTLVVRNKWCSRTDTIVLYKDGWNLLQVFGGDVQPGNVRLRSYDSDLKIGAQELKKDTLAALAMPFEAGKRFKIAVLEKRTGHLIKELYCIRTLARTRSSCWLPAGQ